MLAAGRSAVDDEVSRVCLALRKASALPEVIVAEATIDTSAALHREASLAYFRLAGLDDELSEALYALDFRASSHPFYPDVVPVVRALHARGIRIALVSDIHVDLRPEFEAAGLAKYFNAFVLSFEHGVQKPDRAIFEIALGALEVDASDALMVGDRPSHDGGAVRAGITTLLMPPSTSADLPVGLDRVLALVG
jgi:HAD superfamily hydrolase (TIGR01509 family)